MVIRRLKSLYAQTSGSDGFLTGLPGICAVCFELPHPPYYYCEHNKRLVVWRDGFWETLRDVEREQIDDLVGQTLTGQLA